MENTQIVPLLCILGLILIGVSQLIHSDANIFISTVGMVFIGIAAKIYFSKPKQNNK
jgi:hypothetical protein